MRVFSPTGLRVGIVAAISVALLQGCGATPPPPESSTWLLPTQSETKNLSSGSPLERFFPLVSGMIYTYATVNETSDQGLLVARVMRSAPNQGELRFPLGSKKFEYSPDGIRLVGGQGEPIFVLKAPLEVGTTWRGEHGGQSRILSTSASADTPAGHFEGCIQTLEERLGDRPVRYATTFCADVGVVLLEAAAGASFERAALKSYAEPLVMKQDGSERVPAGAP